MGSWFSNTAFSANWRFRLVSAKSGDKEINAMGLYEKLAYFFLVRVTKNKTNKKTTAQSLLFLEWFWECSALRTEAGIKITSCSHNPQQSCQFTSGLKKVDRPCLLNYSNLKWMFTFRKQTQPFRLVRVLWNSKENHCPQLPQCRGALSISLTAKKQWDTQKQGGGESGPPSRLKGPLARPRDCSAGLWQFVGECAPPQG